MSLVMSVVFLVLSSASSQENVLPKPGRYVGRLTDRSGECSVVVRKRPDYRYSIVGSAVAYGSPEGFDSVTFTDRCEWVSTVDRALEPSGFLNCTSPDSGGTSTELILNPRSGEVVAAYSVPVARQSTWLGLRSSIKRVGPGLDCVDMKLDNSFVVTADYYNGPFEELIKERLQENANQLCESGKSRRISEYSFRGDGTGIVDRLIGAATFVCED